MIVVSMALAISIGAQIFNLNARQESDAGDTAPVGALLLLTFMTRVRQAGAAKQQGSEVSLKLVYLHVGYRAERRGRVQRLADELFCISHIANSFEGRESFVRERGVKRTHVSMPLCHRDTSRAVQARVGLYGGRNTFRRRIRIMKAQKRTALIIGAGPAGSTTALELCRRSTIQPIVFEASDRIGGISCTIRYDGNWIDIGGHRFFSKSDRVMDWWTALMPVVSAADNTVSIQHQSHRHDLSARHTAVERDPEKTDLVMLVRPRKSRIYFQRTFSD